MDPPNVSSTTKPACLAPELLLNSMKKDLCRALTSKTELFMRDNHLMMTQEDVKNPTYVEWLSKTRFSQALIIGIVDRLEQRSAEDLEKFCDVFLCYDACLCLFKASNVSPRRFYADFARWTAADWAQTRLDSRRIDRYDHQIEMPSVKLKLAELAEKVLAYKENDLDDEQTLFLVKVFDDLWSVPLGAELTPWRSTCACPFTTENCGAGHLHECSGCGAREPQANHFKKCARCNQCLYGKNFRRFYCGQACQLAHWRRAHRMYHVAVKNLLDQAVVDC